MSFFTLKLVALLSMLWDHLTYVWPLALTVDRQVKSCSEKSIQASLYRDRGMRNSHSKAFFRTGQWSVR